MLKIIKEHFPKVFVELLIIVVGVLIALFVNDWHAQREVNKNIHHVLTAALNEYRENSEQLKAVANYRKQQIEELYKGGRLSLSVSLKDVNLDLSNLMAIRTSLLNLFRENGWFFDDSKLMLVKIDDDRYSFKIEQSQGTLKVNGDQLELRLMSGIQLKTARLSDSSWNLADASGVLDDINYDTIEILHQIHVHQAMYLNQRQRALDVLYGQQGAIIPIIEDLSNLEKDLMQQYQQAITKLETQRSNL
ncbi:hypothetical protein [Pleionea sediminis]|uniref:hypothetical protein n=1 Tax=Pleionea sediminis TaxID=2569479 RepID=UPI001185CAA2|nr:hypothetical protein [Pleionea sediminis]